MLSNNVSRCSLEYSPGYPFMLNFEFLELRERAQVLLPSRKTEVCKNF